MSTGKRWVAVLAAAIAVAVAGALVEVGLRLCGLEGRAPAWWGGQVCGSGTVIILWVYNTTRRWQP